MTGANADRPRPDGPVLAIEQASTYTKAVIYSRDRRVLAAARDDLPLLHPAPGWAVQDPEEIWASVVASCRMALFRANLAAGALSAVGLACQRSTVILWDRTDGRPIGPAISASDRRTFAKCRALREAGVERVVRERTGLPLSHHASATKLTWMLDNIDGARALAADGKLAFGTVDSFLLWRLTEGRMHATDATQAARTLLFDIRRQRWDDDLLRIFDIPQSVLPRVHDSSSYFGMANSALFGGSGPVAIRGAIGIEQASFLGQGCFPVGSANISYDEGCVASLNVGQTPVAAADGLCTTLGFRLDVGTSYLLEGAAYSVGDGPQWFSEGLGATGDLHEAEALARQSDPTMDVYWVPASLGETPLYKASPGRGTLVGIEPRTGHREFARAVLESIAYQTRDLLEAMAPHWHTGTVGRPVRIMGEAVLSEWTMQFLADLLGRPVERGFSSDPAALGAAWLAASGAGTWPSAAAFADEWPVQQRYEPQLDPDRREEKYAGWRDAVRRSLGPAA